MNLNSILSDVLMKESPRIAVIGSRRCSTEEWNIVLKLIIKIASTHPNVKWSSGGADGIDSILEEAGTILLSYPDYLVIGEHLRVNTKIMIPWSGYNSKNHDGKFYVSCSSIEYTPEMLNKLDYYYEEFYKKYRRYDSESVKRNTTRMLMNRNAHIILGSDLSTPVDLIISVANTTTVVDNVKVVNAEGGTGQAVRLAACLNIPVLNIRFDPHLVVINKYLNS